MAVSKTDINPATGKSYATNPATGNFDDNYWAQNEARFNAGSSPNTQAGISGAISSLSPESVIKNATQVNDFYKQQNQPVIQSYEASKAPLQQRYKDLIDSIKGNQTISENRQTVTTNNELGKRGITGSSGLAQQEITNAVNPITSQYTGMIKDSTNQQNIDLSNIDAIIAKLNAGDPSASLSTATNIGNSQIQASQFNQQLALQQAAQEMARQQAQQSQEQQSFENTLKQYQLDQSKLTDPLQLQLLKNQVAKSGQSSSGGIEELLRILNNQNTNTTAPTEPKPRTAGMSTNQGPRYVTY